MENLSDKYQERYLAHQKRKADILRSNYGTDKFKIYDENEQNTFIEVLQNRRSQRAFNREPVEIEKILALAENRPSSCDRRSIQIKVIESRDDKDLLSGLMVGGVGWAHRADKILLFLAWKDAYKSPAEKEFMSFIDAGILAQTLYLTCEAMNVGACYINPNIRAENKEFFYNRFVDEGYQYVGAMAIGHYDLKHTYTPIKESAEEKPTSEDTPEGLATHPTKENWCCACDYDIVLLKDLIAQERNKVKEEIINELESNPNEDGSISPNIMHWIEKKQAQLRKLFINPKEE